MNVMIDTGRLRESLDPRARVLLFDDIEERAIREEIVYYAQIDRAHLVMLAERQILRRDHVQRLLAAIDDLVARDYAPRRGRAAPRGAYLVYEHWLIETLGESIGGAAHIGRSRNDLTATVVRLRLRPVYRRLAGDLLHLIATLTRRAEQHAALTMPVYTHAQAALPITFGHYLAGVALALVRDLRGLEDAVRDLDCCPLGAGAAGGTTVPIDCERTARLLGFTDAVLHSVDAVASRDFVLRLLAAASVLGITLSRLAMDLQLWSTAEFGEVAFPDRLVGSSSMMPQKRNAFLLEHIKARSASPLGGLTASAMAMHGTPFSNSIAVGTEAVKHLWAALDDLDDAVILSRLVIAGAQPQPERMRRRTIDGCTSATELANQLVVEAGLSFRQAHHRVGEAVRLAIERGEEAVGVMLPDPAEVASRAAFGGGPAPSSLDRILAELRRQSSVAHRALRDRSQRWRTASRALAAAVDDLLMKREVEPCVTSS
jgi:argininosuccinate lyase